MRHAGAVLRTDRLVLRAWRPQDRAPFAAMNADPQVMELFVAAMTGAQSNALLERIEAHFAEHGFGLWAVEERATGRFLGFTGLARLTFDAPFTPAVEVGWRLTRAAWGKGHATEAAKEAIRYGFEQVGLSEVVSMTAASNLRSRAVMVRLGMTRDPADDFDHPLVPAGHPLQRHVLYRLTAVQWRNRLR